MSELALKLIAEAKEKRLTTLDLGNCSLTEIPEELFELVWLEELWFDNLHVELGEEMGEISFKRGRYTEARNQLSTLPQNFIKLQQLNKLILSGNYGSKSGIRDITPLASLKKLTTLDISYNQISELTPLSSLTKLTKLDLRSNQISELTPIASLTKLIKLDLCSNQISELTPIASLTKLTKLDLRSNQISELTPLTLLTKLTTLDLRSNQISELRPLNKLIEGGLKVELADDHRMPIFWRKGFFIKDNPLKKPPIEVIEQGNQAILDYFKDLDQQGTGKLNEAKLIIVGEPEAGKTTLMECLLDPNYTLSNDTQSTLGIEVREGWQFPHPKQKDEIFTTNIWNFGGQQIQYMTHQFFLTPSAAYILLSANDRKEPTNFPYWFKIIHLLGEEQGRYSPVLVVLNEKNDQFPFNFDLKFYQDRYPELEIKVCEVDLSQRDSRFQVLRETIQKQLSQLSHVNDPRPALWEPIREALRTLAQQKDYINFAEYAEICQQHGVVKEASQMLLSGYLHRLGSLLHFSDDPMLRDLIILKPQWAVDAVYSVLVDTEIERQRGVFSQKKLDSIWKNYTFVERANLLNLMKQENFEICYAVEGKANTFIAPQLLSDQQPDYEWDEGNSLKFRFQYKFMPEGIITRLIVRLHELIVQNKEGSLSWRKGVLLQQNGCRAQVHEEENRAGLKVIDIVITGDANKVKQRKFLLHTIREEIHKIHRKWFRNIQAEQMIPCVCAYCIHHANDMTYFEFSTLNRAYERGIATMRCDKDFIEVSVKVLLEGVFDKTVFANNSPEQNIYNTYHIHGGVKGVLTTGDNSTINQDID